MPQHRHEQAAEDIFPRAAALLFFITRKTEVDAHDDAEDHVHGKAGQADERSDSAAVEDFLQRREAESDADEGQGIFIDVLRLKDLHHQQRQQQLDQFLRKAGVAERPQQGSGHQVHILRLCRLHADACLCKLTPAQFEDQHAESDSDESGDDRPDDADRDRNPGLLFAHRLGDLPLEHPDIDDGAKRKADNR